jgi:hypothetical protein
MGVHEYVVPVAYNLTYNAYFDKFIAAELAVNEPAPGYYYPLSEDLIY